MAQSFDAAVDVVSSAHNNFDDMTCIFKEVARVLRPRGQLFSVLPTNRCSRRTFKGLTTTFLEAEEVVLLLMHSFTSLDILRSSYQLSNDCLIDNWIVTGRCKE